MSTQDMNHKQAELVSALVDGELGEHSADETITHLEQNAEARQRWMRYHMISDVVKGHTASRVDSGFADRISAIIADEPAILAPQTKKSMPAFIIKHASGFAVAATVAVVAVLAVQPESAIETGVQQVAATAPADNAEWVRVNTGVNWNVEKPSVESKLNAYLVNHNGYSSGVRGILPYAPIVSYDSSAQMKYENMEAAPIEYKENTGK